MRRWIDTLPSSNGWQCGRHRFNVWAYDSRRLFLRLKGMLPCGSKSCAGIANITGIADIVDSASEFSDQMNAPHKLQSDRSFFTLRIDLIAYSIVRPTLRRFLDATVLRLLTATLAIHRCFISVSIGRSDHGIRTWNSNVWRECDSYFHSTRGISDWDWQSNTEISPTFESKVLTQKF